MRADLGQIFRAAVAACHPVRVLAPHLPPAPAGRVVILALGKAAGGMAAVAEAAYGDQAFGIAVVPDGVNAGLERVALVHAGHPIPNAASVVAAEHLLELARRAGPNDAVLVLLSGGASALACLPGFGLGLDEKQEVTEALLRSGAPIGDINCVRRHLSRIKGGRLALAGASAPMVTLAISDVVGDSPGDIGSGPTVAGRTNVDHAKAILGRYGIAVPVHGWSPLPDIPPRPFEVVAGGRSALDAASREAERLGYRPVLLGECTGEAREVARDHAGLALDLPPGRALISGGELTVAVTGDGRGGPNTEYALAAGLTLAHRPDIAGLAADTDGIDGTSGAAGAFFGGAPLPGAAEALAANDSASCADLFVTGPTGTNVNDLRIILVRP
ncbi:MAG TPA: DUF4147 domain-containing protein [Allosphingosinicella sp.]|nr:DUF4147 domain-containing protein [Allosphingosinicella sp.]